MVLPQPGPALTTVTRCRAATVNWSVSRVRRKAPGGSPGGWTCDPAELVVNSLIADRHLMPLVIWAVMVASVVPGRLPARRQWGCPVPPRRARSRPRGSIRVIGVSGEQRAATVIAPSPARSSPVSRARSISTACGALIKHLQQHGDRLP